MSRDVFISYSQPDHDCAMELVTSLEGQGIECWIAPRDIVPSADWAAEIIDAISRAHTMVLIFSKSSNESPQVRREVERAVHKQISILPFRLENVMPSKSLEYFLSAQHWMDAFPPPREPHYARLCTYLKNRSRATASDLTRSGATSTAPLGSQHVAIESARGADHIPALIAQAELQRIERLLAGYIGPVARHLVKKAAVGATGLDELAARLATELETETDRYQFTQRVRAGAAPQP